MNEEQKIKEERIQALISDILADKSYEVFERHLLNYAENECISTKEFNEFNN